MIYIVTFRKPTVINILSIVASVLSVTTKSVMFCYVRDFKVFLLNLCCFTVDIFSIFAILSWVFDDYPYANNNHIINVNLLSLIYKYKVLCITFPCSIWLSLYILFNRETPIQGLKRLYNSVSGCLCFAPLFFLIGFASMSILLMFVFIVMTMVIEIICFGMLPWFTHSRNQPHKSLAPYFNYLFEWIQQSYPYPVSFGFYFKCCQKCERNQKTEQFVQHLTNLDKHTQNHIELTVTNRNDNYLRLESETEIKHEQDLDIDVDIDIDIHLEQKEEKEYTLNDMDIETYDIEKIDKLQVPKFLEIDWKFRIFLTNFIHFQIFLKNVTSSHDNDVITDTAKYILRFFKVRLGLYDDEHFKCISEFFRHSTYSFDLRKLHNIVIDKQYCTSFKQQFFHELSIMIPMPFNRFLGNGIFKIGYIQSGENETRKPFICNIWEFIGFKILVPLFIVSKLMNLIYPFIYLIIYISNLSQIDDSLNWHSFQITFTLIFIGLILFGIMPLLPFAYRYYITLWHLSAINVNRRVIAKYFSNQQQIESIVRNTKYLYYQLYIMMISTQLIKDKFGTNIGDIINEYVFNPKVLFDQIMYQQDIDQKILKFEPIDIYENIQEYIC